MFIVVIRIKMLSECKCFGREEYRYSEKKYTKAFEYRPQAAIFRMSCSTSDPRHLVSGVSPEPLTFHTSAP